VRAVHSANQLIEFELNGVAITVLGLLNQKTIKNVTIVVTVFMTNCHVSLNLSSRMARGSRRPLREAGKRR
jgi:hypothetical protein